MPKTAPVTMYDAVAAGSIPAGAPVVAGYIDGFWEWAAREWALFPRALKVLITVTGLLNGNVADVEHGDLTPAMAEEWLTRKERAGHRGATIYCNRATLPAVQAACRGHAYYVWVADWTGGPHPVPGSIATQYASVDNRFDVSMIYSQDWLDVIDAANRPWPLQGAR